MKLVTYSSREHGENQPRVGALTADGRGVVDLHSPHRDDLVAAGADAMRAVTLADAVFGDMVALIEAGPTGLETARAILDRCSAEGSPSRLGREAVRLEVPLRPPRLRDCIAWETHIRNFYEKFTGGPVPEAYYKIPVYYKGNHTTVFAHDEDVPWPSYSSKWDYELELGLVIGSAAVDVPAAQAESHIFGLTCFNDFSARDTLQLEMAVGLGPSKGKDFANAIGPCITTIDEFPDLYDIKMQARINDEVWSSGGTSDIHWRFDQIIERMSLSEPLIAGEIVGSGTIGYGCGLELDRFLQDGDVVELEIEGIGTLRNRVVAA